MLLVVILVAVLAPWLAPYDPQARVQVSPEDILARPTPSTGWGATTRARTS